MRYSVLVGLMLVSCLGCNVKEMRREQAGARQAILRLYEDQIVDNLIRACRTADRTRGIHVGAGDTDQ